jgi:hypothetical protein
MTFSAHFGTPHTNILRDALGCAVGRPLSELGATAASWNTSGPLFMRRVPPGIAQRLGACSTASHSNPAKPEPKRGPEPQPDISRGWSEERTEPPEKPQNKSQVSPEGATESLPPTAAWTFRNLRLLHNSSPDGDQRHACQNSTTPFPSDPENQAKSNQIKPLFSSSHPQIGAP